MARQLTDQDEVDIQTFVSQSQASLKEASETIASHVEKIASQEATIAQLQEQKTASVVPFKFDEQQVADVLDKMASSGLTKQEVLPALRQEIERDPSVVLAYLGKIASEVGFPVKPIGQTEKTASVNSSTSDEHNPNAASDANWAQFMAGRS